MYPTPQTYILHNSQGQFYSLHSFILALNIFNDVTLFNSVGIISQIFGPSYRRDSSPKEVVRTLLVLKMLFDEYNNVSLRGKMLVIIAGLRPLTTLYSSIARVWMFLI